jgi:hypothetical protein
MERSAGKLPWVNQTKIIPLMTVRRVSEYPNCAPSSNHSNITTLGRLRLLTSMSQNSLEI